MTTVEGIIADSVKKARQFALSCDYGNAKAFYSGLDDQLVMHCQKLEDQGAPEAAQWQRLRSQLAVEYAHIKTIMDELDALANPAAAVRLDRANGGGRPAREPSSGSYDNGPARRQAPVRAAARPPYRTDDDNDAEYGYDEPAPPPLAAHRERPIARPRQAPERRAGGGSPGDYNEALYGDRDRFGPDAGNPAVGFGVPPPVPRRKPRSTSSGPSNAPSNGGNAGRAASGPSTGANTGARERRKPAIPKFGRKDDGGDAGGNGNGADGKKAKKKPPFQPRPGDEDFASAIAADMLEPGSIKISFDDIAGQEEAKQALEEAAILPALMPDIYQGALRPPKGVLLYGPPGTGKSLLASAVASQADTTFFNVSPATLMSKMRGDSERLVRVLFDMARHHAPSIIFIDEIDSMCASRSSDTHEASRRMLSVLLLTIDGVGVDTTQHVTLLGATNHPWDIDDAMRRRFEARVYVALPGPKERADLLRLKTKDCNLGSDVDFDVLSKEVASLNYSGSDLAVLVTEALRMPVRRVMAKHRELIRNDNTALQALIKAEPTTMADFREAVRKTPSSTNLELVAKYEEWRKKFQQP